MPHFRYSIKKEHCQRAWAGHPCLQPCLESFGPCCSEDGSFAAPLIKAFHHCFDELPLWRHRIQTLLPAEDTPSALLGEVRLIHLIPQHFPFWVTSVQPLPTSETQKSSTVCSYETLSNSIISVCQTATCEHVFEGKASKKEGRRCLPVRSGTAFGIRHGPLHCHFHNCCYYRKWVKSHWHFPPLVCLVTHSKHPLTHWWVHTSWNILVEKFESPSLY